MAELRKARVSKRPVIRAGHGQRGNLVLSDQPRENGVANGTRGVDVEAFTSGPPPPPGGPRRLHVTSGRSLPLR